MNKQPDPGPAASTTAGLRPPIDRRQFLQLAAGAGATGLGSSLLASCSSSSTPSGRKPLANGISSLTPKKGGRLVFGLDAEVSGFDPSVSPWPPAGVDYAVSLFDPLAILMADGTVRPYLAQSITPNADYTVWTITMRPNVLFHDGTPCDAKAIAYNFDHFNKSEFFVFLTDMKAAKVTGPLTVDIEMNSPWVPFPAFLTGSVGAQVGWIAAPSMLRSSNGAANPVGTGPFKFVEWIPNDHMTAERNPHYWRSGLPYLDQIEYRPIPSSSSRSNGLQAGNIDIMIDATTQVMVEYMHNPGYSYIDTLGEHIGEPSVNFVMLNMTRSPFDNLLARKALAYATDVERYNKVIANNVPAVLDGPFVPGSPYYVPTGYPTYDLKQASALVRQYQSSTGKRFEFTIQGPAGGATETEILSFWQGTWQQAGMSVNTSLVAEAAMIDNAINHKFDAIDWTQFSAPDPDCNYAFWRSGSLANFPGNDDGSIDAELVSARSSTNLAVRRQAYQAVSKHLAADLPYIWTNSAPYAVMAGAHTMNFANPTSPDGGKALGMKDGFIWPTQIWLND